MPLMLTLLTLATLAQQPSVRQLTTPDVETRDAFTRVADVRELRDGRVLVLDKQERIIQLVDMRTGTMTQVGRQGPGPGEYRLPLRLYALPGDSALAFDMANGTKGLVITPQGTAAGILSSSAAGAEPVRVTEGIAIDARGRIYSGIRNAKGDSIGIERLDRATGKKEIIAFTSPYLVSPLRPARGGGSARGTGAAGGGIARAGGAPPPFASRDQWAVAPDGRVAVVTVEPYRVTFTEPNGVRRAGEPIRTDRIPVDGAIQDAWRKEEKRPVATLISNGSGSTVATYRPPRYEEPREWPEYLPPFLDEAVTFAPDGMLWVHRTAPADAPPRFDVIGPNGRVAYHLDLPRRTRLVGFGANAVYLVRIDDDDLEYLQRHRLPAK